MSRTRVKICGVCNVTDAIAAVTAGADAIGLVFYPESRRALSPAQAGQISRALPPFVSRVALFLDAAAEAVSAVLDDVKPDLLQFHGRETPAYCRQFGMRYIKTVPMGEPGVDPVAWAREYNDAEALLLDANRSGEAGGRGERFEWATEREAIDMPLVVAGGLDAANVGRAIARFRPYAVDVSSGVESASGRKDARLMQAFMNAVRVEG